MDTMLRLEIAIQRLEAAIKRQEELHKTTREQIVLLNKMVAVVLGLHNPTAVDIIKSNGLTGPVVLDISKINPPYYWEELASTLSKVRACQQSQASNGSNKSSQAEEEEAPKSNEDIKASLQRIDNILTESDSANDFATKASEKSDSDTKGHKQ